MKTFWLTRRFANEMRPLGGPVRTKVDHGRFRPTVEPLDPRMMFAITASLSAATGVLTVTGDDQDNSIALSFNAAGSIVVNGGAVAIQGGTPTATNTRLIQIFALGGNDTLIWAGSANLPAGHIDGGAGNDTITSGSGNDDLIGGAGNDTYRLDTDAALGRDTIDESGGGIDLLDFSSTTTRAVSVDLGNTAVVNFSPTTTRAVSIDLGNAAEQVVNAGLTLTLLNGSTIENVIGGALGDTLTGNALNNTIEGGGGNDRLDGGAGNDTYRFDTDNPLGNDSIAEVDKMIDVNSGVDTLDFSATTTRAVNINLGIKGDQVVNAGLTLGFGSDAIENVIGGALGDTLRGNALNNALTGGAGNDTLIGGAGNDTYPFDTDNALGSDTIDESGGGVDTLDFSATTTRAVNINLGNAAAQVVNAGLTLTLSSGNTINNAIGGALGDTLTGNALNNALTGGAGNDTLIGGAGNDTLIGGAGNDTYRFDTDSALGSDTIDESAGGSDTLDFSATTTRAVTINLANAAAQVVNAGLTLTLSSGSTMNNVIGGALGDTLTGNALNNLLTGGVGNDTLNGAAGIDTLDGGAGTDVAIGGETLISIP